MFARSQNNFVAIVDLPEGEHQYKFCVDGQWTLDPTGVSERTTHSSLPQVKLVFFPLLLADLGRVLQAVTTSKTGVVNNLIQVNRTDFEVFDALRIDSQDSADLSGASSCVVVILIVIRQNISSSS